LLIYNDRFANLFFFSFAYGIDESAAYYTAMIHKVKKLLESRLNLAHKEDQAHYQSILLLIKSIEK